MKKLMFIALTLTATFAFAADYAPSKLPSNTTQPDVMPGLVNYQGLLRAPATGAAYADGLYDLECRLYTSLTGTTPIWGAKYQVYVRDGYFNLMLGSSGTELSGCTYTSAYLWKALWYNGSNQSLYLGVTPWQNADGTTIADADKRVEISPRQQLLASPFALRAQKAQYADAATGDFNVQGNLKVTGQILTSDGSAFGLKNVTASDDEIKIGKDIASPAATSVQGGEVTIESGDAMNVNPGGNATITMAAGKTLKVQGGCVAGEDLDDFNFQSESIKMYTDATKKTGIQMLQQTQATTISGGDQLEMRANSGSVALKLTANDENTIAGTGKLKWRSSGSYSFTSPIVYRTVVVTLPKNALYASASINDLLDASSAVTGLYTWSIAGYAMVQGSSMNSAQWHSPELRVLRCCGSTIQIGMDEADSVSRQFKIELMGVCSKWCDDKRTYADSDMSYKAL